MTIEMIKREVLILLDHQEMKLPTLNRILHSLQGMISGTQSEELALRYHYASKDRNEYIDLLNHVLHTVIPRMEAESLKAQKNVRLKYLLGSTLELLRSQDLIEINTLLYSTGKISADEATDRARMFNLIVRHSSDQARQYLINKIQST